MTQVIERMFETIGLHSPTPDLGDTIERSWTMLLYAGFFGPITEEFFFRWGRLARLGALRENLCHCYDGYLVWTLSCQF